MKRGKYAGGRTGSNGRGLKRNKRKKIGRGEGKFCEEITQWDELKECKYEEKRIMTKEGRDRKEWR